MIVDRKWNNELEQIINIIEKSTPSIKYDRETGKSDNKKGSLFHRNSVHAFTGFRKIEVQFTRPVA